MPVLGAAGYVEPTGEFADHVDGRGRYVRDWRYGSGHRPLVEIHEDPDPFDPPFGSGDVLVRLPELSQDGVDAWALSEANWRRAALDVAAWRIRTGV